MKRRPEPLEIDVARHTRDIHRWVPHRVAVLGPDFVLATARLMALQLSGAGLGYRETLKLLDHLSALEMTPASRAQAAGRWPWDEDVGGGDDAA